MQRPLALLKTHSLITSIQHFKNSSHLTVYGSIAYEAIRMVHSLFLLSYFGVQEYGFLASFVSVIDFGERVAGGGASYSLGLFKLEYTKNKQCFKSFLWKHSFFPLLLRGIGVAACAAWWFRGAFDRTTTLLIFIMVINIIIGPMVGFMRMLLYTMEQTKKTILYELGSLVAYIASFWALFFARVFLSIEVLACFRLMHCVLLFGLFSSLIFFLLGALPEGHESFTLTFSSRVRRARFDQWILRMGRSFFSATLLTPFFALYFGMHTAAFFYMMNKVTRKLLDVMKAIIYFSGASLLCIAQTQKNFVRKRVFFQLCFNTSGYLAAGSLLILANYLLFLWLYACEHICKDMIFMTLMIALRALEYYIVLYEQAYNAYQTIAPLVVIKVSEALLFGVILSLSSNYSTNYILVTIAIVQCISLAVIMADAFRRWQLVPSIGISYHLLWYGGMVSLVAHGCLLFQRY